MGDRKDLPKITPQEKPTLFNREAGGWGVVGNIVGGVAGSFSGNAATKTMVQYAGTAAGALYGGLKGKARQQKEQVEGRVVKKPTVWNSGFWGGAVVSSLVIAPIAHFNSKTIEAAAAAGHASPLLAGVGLGLFTLGLAAPIYGSLHRKKSMQRDLEQAKALQANQQAQAQGMGQDVTVGQVQEQPLSYKNSVSPAEAAALAEKQAEKSSSHVAAMEAAQAQQPAAARV